MNYSGITRASFVNGEGSRVVLWVSGCEHQCVGCHNKDTWDLWYGQRYDLDAECELFYALNRPQIDGLTLSGGDPLHKSNVSEVTGICKKFRDIFGYTKTIWLYTGYSWFDINNLDIMQYLDVVVDGVFIANLYDESLKYKGSFNQRIIDVQKSLNAGGIVLWE